MLKGCLTPIVKHGGTLTLTQNVKVWNIFVLVKGDLYRVNGILNKKVIILFSNTMPNPGVSAWLEPMSSQNREPKHISKLCKNYSI